MKKLFSLALALLVYLLLVFPSGCDRPLIKSIRPDRGPIGTEITVIGVNFGETRGSSTLRIERPWVGSHLVETTEWTDRRIVGTVPEIRPGQEDVPGAYRVYVSIPRGVGQTYLDSNKVTFTVTGSGFPVRIDRISQGGGWSGGSGYPELYFSGTGFGDAIGNKVVRIGSHAYGAGNICHEEWREEHIIVCVDALDFVFGTYYDIYLTENGQKISNTIERFFIRMEITEHEILPESPTAGSTAEVGGCFSPTQGNRRVKFGSGYAQVLSWSGSTVKIRVPGFPPGTYDFYIEENGVEVSNRIRFEIFPG